MKVNIEPARIREIRCALGLTVAQFAAVLAVHAGTVHRWESSGDALVPIDGVAANLLTALDKRIPSSRSGGEDFPAREVGQEIVEALLVGGALLALGYLIWKLVGDPKR